MKLKALALVAALCAPVVVFADDYNKDTTKDTTTKDTTKTSDTNKGMTNKEVKLSDSELNVMAHVHAVNQLEIDAAKLAEKKGSTQPIKSYAKMIVKDHEQSDRDLNSLAKKHDQKIAKESATNEADQKEISDARSELDRMKNLKSADFDREFLQFMVDSHDKELAKIDSEVGQVQDPRLSQMIKDLKPVLQRHADEARNLQKSNAQASMNPPTSATNPSSTSMQK